MVIETPSTFQPITLVRHGESTWNELRIVQGQNNLAELTERGRTQAREVGRELRHLEIQKIISSDLRRARDTAAIIADVIGVDVVLEPLLRERSFGVFEGGPLSEMTSEVTGISDGVLVDPDARPPGGESFRDVVARAQHFMERVQDVYSDERLLVVTHGGTIRALRAACDATPLQGLAWDRVANTSVWTLEPS